MAKEKVSGSGRYGVKVVFSDGPVTIAWFKTKKERDANYREKFNTKSRRIQARIQAGVADHTITKIQRLFG